MEARERELLARHYRSNRVVIGTAWTGSDTALASSVLVLLVLSGFFAMAETSLVRMNKSRARSLKEQCQARGRGRW